MSNLRAYVMILICPLFMQSPDMRGQAESQSTSASETTNIAEKITQLEHERSQAQVQGDASKLDELLAPEFVEINSSANVRTKEQNLQAHKTGQIHWQKFDLDDLIVHVDGDTAVVTGRLTRKGTFAGRDLSGRSRYTRYYLKRNGHWQAIFQYSVPEATTK
jgi:ketosteroid isomerase-like protein